MFVTFTIPKGGTDPDVSTLSGWTTPPPAFPDMVDTTYNKTFRNLGAGAKEYCVGLPVSDPDGFIVPGEGVHIGLTRLADVVVTVPIHTCIGYRWFYDQSPTNIQIIGPTLVGDIPGGRIVMGFVVMN